MGKSPAELKKRARKLNDKDVRKKAKYVLCWLQQNIRAADNPAIDAVIALPHGFGLADCRLFRFGAL